MKANKKGISLIVLIITIVVIIILAAAIILNLSNTNVITNANKAVAGNDLQEYQSAVTLKYGDIYVEKHDTPTVREVLYGYPLETPQGVVVAKENRTIKGVNDDFLDAANGVQAKAKHIKVGTVSGGTAGYRTDSKPDADFIDSTDLSRSGAAINGDYYLLKDFVVHYGNFANDGAPSDTDDIGASAPPAQP